MTRTRVVRPTFLPWTWTKSLEATWRGYEIPIHECHTWPGQVNGLVGGWTVIDSSGTYLQSGVFGCFTPTGVNKDGHVERQLITAIDAELRQAMSDDITFNDDVLALVEINQWFTPCSGPKGCARYLDTVVKNYAGIFNEVTAGGRFQAKYEYQSQLAEPYYKRVIADFNFRIAGDMIKNEDRDDFSYGSDDEKHIMHQDPGSI